ncbi:MAG: alpha/beta hydrolase [Burkholderiales bacterium]
MRTLQNLLLAGIAPILFGGCSPFAVVNAVAPRDGVIERLDIAYGTDARHRLDVFLPSAPLADPTPVIVFFYGGAWQRGDRSDYSYVGRALATRGVIAVVPDYRVYPEVVFPGFVEDGALAVKWAQQNLLGEARQVRPVFLMGHSAGAHLAGMLALDRSYLQRAGADANRIAGFIGLSGPYDFRPLQSRTLKRIFGDPAPDSTQPVEFVTADAPPALLITGSADTTVVPQNTGRLAARLRDNRVAVTEIVYDGVGHARTIAAFSPLLAGDLDILERITRFVAPTAGHSGHVHPGRGRLRTDGVRFKDAG